MQQTTSGILVESCTISRNSKKANIFCLDFEGFSSSGRSELTSEEEISLDSKLMLLAYSMSNVVIFSMHAADISSLREFVHLMRKCVPAIKTNDQSKKPTLYLFINVNQGDKNTIMMMKGLKGKSQDEIREGIHGMATQGLLSQNEFKECKLYFSEVIVETLYPNQKGNETEGFIINSLKESVYEKSLASELQDSSFLFDEKRWNANIKSINSNEQIEFASDVLERMSETNCYNMCEILKKEFDLKGPNRCSVSELTNLKSKLILEYWKEAKGKFAKMYYVILNDYLEEVSSKLSSKIFLNQINQITKEFKIELSTFISNGFTNLKLKNFRSNFLERWEHELSMQEFSRLTEKIDNFLEEMMEDYSYSKMETAESQLKSLFKKEKIDFSELQTLVDETKDHLLSIPIINSSQVTKWYERNLTIISNKKLEEEMLKQKNKELVEMKMFFLDSLANVTRIDQLDLLLKRSLLNLQSKYEGKELVECEKFFRKSYDDYLATYNFE